MTKNNSKTNLDESDCTHPDHNETGCYHDNSDGSKKGHPYTPPDTMMGDFQAMFEKPTTPKAEDLKPLGEIVPMPGSVEGKDISDHPSFGTLPPAPDHWTEPTSDPKANSVMFWAHVKGWEPKTFKASTLEKYKEPATDFKEEKNPIDFIKMKKHHKVIWDLPKEHPMTEEAFSNAWYDQEWSENPLFKSVSKIFKKKNISEVKDLSSYLNGNATMKDYFEDAPESLKNQEVNFYAHNLLDHNTEGIPEHEAKHNFKQLANNLFHTAHHNPDYYGIEGLAGAMLEHKHYQDPATAKAVHDSFIEHINKGMKAGYDNDGNSYGVGHHFLETISGHKHFPHVPLTPETFKNKPLTYMALNSQPLKVLKDPNSSLLSSDDFQTAFHKAGKEGLNDPVIFDKAVKKLSFNSLFYHSLHSLEVPLPHLNEDQIDSVIKKDGYQLNSDVTPLVELTKQAFALNFDKYLPELIKSAPNGLAGAVTHMTGAGTEYSGTKLKPEQIHNVIFSAIKMATSKKVDPNAVGAYSEQHKANQFLDSLAGRQYFLSAHPETIESLFNSPARRALVNTLYGNQSSILRNNDELMKKLDDTIVPKMSFDELGSMTIMTPRREHELKNFFDQNAPDIDLGVASSVLSKYGHMDGLLNSIVNWADTPLAVESVLLPHVIRGNLKNSHAATSKVYDLINSKPKEFFTSPYGALTGFTNLDPNIENLLNEKFAEHCDPTLHMTAPESYAGKYGRLLNNRNVDAAPLPPLKPIPANHIINSVGSNLDFIIKNSHNIYFHDAQYTKLFKPEHLAAIQSNPNNGAFALAVLANILPPTMSPGGFREDPAAYEARIRAELPQIFDGTPKIVPAEAFDNSSVMKVLANIDNVKLMPASGYYSTDIKIKDALLDLAYVDPLKAAKIISKLDMTTPSHVLNKFSASDHNALITQISNNPEALDLFTKKLIQPGTHTDHGVLKSFAFAAKIPIEGFTEDVLRNLPDDTLVGPGGTLAKNLQHVKPSQFGPIFKRLEAATHSSYALDPSLKPMMRNLPKVFVKAFMKGLFDKKSNSHGVPDKINASPEDLALTLKNLDVPMHNVAPAVNDMLDDLVETKNISQLQNDLSPYAKIKYMVRDVNSNLIPLAMDAINSFDPSDPYQGWNLLSDSINMDSNARPATYEDENQRIKRITGSISQNVQDAIFEKGIETLNIPRENPEYTNPVLITLERLGLYQDEGKLNNVMDRVTSKEVLKSLGEKVKPNLLEKPAIFQKFFDNDIPLNKQAVADALENEANVTYLKNKLANDPNAVTGDKASYLPYVMDIDELYTGHDHKFVSDDYTNFITSYLNIHKEEGKKKMEEFLDHTDSWDILLAMRNVNSLSHKPDMSRRADFYKKYDKAWNGFWQGYCGHVEPSQFAKIRSAFFENDKPTEVTHRNRVGSSESHSDVDNAFLREMAKRSQANVKKHLDLGKFKGLSKDRIIKRPDGGYNVILGRGVSGNFAYGIMENLGLFKKKGEEVTGLHFKSDSVAVINELPFTSFSHSFRSNMGFTQRGIKGHKAAGVIFTQEVPLEQLALCENLGFHENDSHAHRHELEWMVLNPGGAIVLSPNDIVYASGEQFTHGNKSHPLYRDLVKSGEHQEHLDEGQDHEDKVEENPHPYSEEDEETPKPNLAGKSTATWTENEKKVFSNESSIAGMIKMLGGPNYPVIDEKENTVWYNHVVSVLKSLGLKNKLSALGVPGY